MEYLSSSMCCTIFPCHTGVSLSDRHGSEPSRGLGSERGLLCAGGPVFLALTPGELQKAPTIFAYTLNQLRPTRFQERATILQTGVLPLLLSCFSLLPLLLPINFSYNEVSHQRHPERGQRSSRGHPRAVLLRSRLQGSRGGEWDVYSRLQTTHSVLPHYRCCVSSSRISGSLGSTTALTARSTTPRRWKSALLPSEPSCSSRARSTRLTPLNSDSPAGSLPYIKLGDKLLTQSYPILRYFSRQLGGSYEGKTSEEKYFVDVSLPLLLVAEPSSTLSLIPQPRQVICDQALDWRTRLIVGAFDVSKDGLNPSTNAPAFDNHKDYLMPSELSALASTGFADGRAYRVRPRYREAPRRLALLPKRSLRPRRRNHLLVLPSSPAAPPPR